SSEDAPPAGSENGEQKARDRANSRSIKTMPADADSPSFFALEPQESEQLALSEDDQRGRARSGSFG
ncbi:unnamed protein product, partial [Amoebophrya sp. A120]